MMLPTKTELKLMSSLEKRAETVRMEQARTKEAMVRKDKEAAAMCLFNLQVFLAARSAQKD